MFYFFLNIHCNMEKAGNNSGSNGGKNVNNLEKTIAENESR